MERRDWNSCCILLLVAFLLLNVSANEEIAQEKYPSKPIQFFVGYPAGGTTDLCARPLALAASKILGQSIGVLNRPGGASASAMASLTSTPSLPGISPPLSRLRG